MQELRTQLHLNEAIQLTFGAGPALSTRWPLHRFLCPDDEASTFKEDWIPEGLGGDDDDVRIKWFELHQKHWETLNSTERAAGIRALEGNEFVQHMGGHRLKDLLALLYADAQPRSIRSGEFLMPSPLPIDPEPETLWDLDQNIGRVPVGYGYVPCALPRARVWLRNRARFLSGAEALLLQGADPKRLPTLRPGVWSSKFLQDMAGNAFCVPAFGAFFLSLLASI
jgi:hypothetical protein